MARMLKPEGVQIHQLTDAQYDRTGLEPNNTKPLDGTQPLTFKAGDWNKVKLTLAGDSAALAVNGVEIGSVKLEPANSRIFGLFRYADASGVRVRNVTYRGNWPTVVPPVEKQELAQVAK